MCLIIRKPAGVEVETTLLTQSFLDNSHGWGIMYAHRGRVEVRKGMDMSVYIKTVHSLPEQELIIHTRLATHGVKNLDNCHPFKVTRNLWLMHNGIINNYEETNPRMSDTWHFAQWLRRIVGDDKSLVRDPQFIELMEHRVGIHNKLVLLQNDGYVATINGRQGTEYKDLWLSNTHSCHGKAWYKRGSKVVNDVVDYCITAATSMFCAENAPVENFNVVADATKRDGEVDRLSKLCPWFFGLDRDDAVVLASLMSTSIHEISDADAVSLNYYQTKIADNMLASGLQGYEIYANFYQACERAKQEDSAIASKLATAHLVSRPRPAQPYSHQQSTALAVVPRVTIGPYVPPAVEIPKVDPFISKPEVVTEVVTLMETCGLFGTELLNEEACFWRKMLQNPSREAPRYSADFYMG